MLKLGDRVHWSDSVTEGTVTLFDNGEFAVHWDYDAADAAQFLAYSCLVERTPGQRHIQIVPADPAPAPTTTDHGVTLAGWYAAQVGTMEVRLADVYFVTKRAQEAVAKGNAAGLNWQLDHIIEAIERTADKLASLTSPSGSDDAGWLHSRVYANRK